MLGIPMRAVALFVLILLAACGGSERQSETVAGGDPGRAEGSGTAAAGTGRCQDFFGPDRIDAGENCAPAYHEHCASNFGSGGFSREEIPPCEGVLIDTVEIEDADTFSGFLKYVVLRPANGEPRAVVTSLHFRQLLRDPVIAANTFATHMRLHELVKGRNTMVILPGAPAGKWQQLSPTGVLDSIEESGLGDIPLLDLLGGVGSPLYNLLVGIGLPVGLLDTLFQNGGTLADVADALDNLAPLVGSIDDYLQYARTARDHALERFGGAGLPQFVSGLSNGAGYAMRLACRHPEEVDAFMTVGGAVGALQVPECKGNPPVGSVQVHGINDPLSPYLGIITYPIRGGVPPISENFTDGEIDGIPEGVTSALLSKQPGLFLDVFGPNNGCGDEVKASTLPAGSAGRGEIAGDVVVERFADCSNGEGRKSYMVTVTRGGHNWPGYDAPAGTNVNAFGAVSYDFDATLYGFDLMWRAAGLD
jgi:pimeloyl-ACP methyl ester carboxylesterase